MQNPLILSKRKQYVFTLKHSIDGGFHLRCIQCVCANLRRILPAKCDNLAWSHAWDWSYSCFRTPVHNSQQKSRLPEHLIKDFFRGFSLWWPCSVVLNLSYIPTVNGFKISFRKWTFSALFTKLANLKMMSNQTVFFCQF